MREYRVDRGSSYGVEQGAGARDLAREKTPEERATERAYRLRQEAESAAVGAKNLSAIVQRDEWRTEQASLKQIYAVLVEQLKERAADAHASEQVQRHHEAATRELGEIGAALANAKEPRAMPPVHGEEAIEPLIIARTIQADDVLAWVAELDSGQRRALADRVRRVQGSADRSDSFSVALANYLAATRITSQFFGVAENPRRFNRAAYEQARARANASAAEAEADTVAGTIAMHGPGVRLPPITAAPAAHVQLAPNTPVVRVDKSQEAKRLRAMIAMRQQRQIVELLEHNANPEHMYALHRAYGSTLVANVQGALTEPAYLARAMVYLGEQMPLDAKIEARGKGDVEAILGDLERLPDVRALALFAGEAAPVASTATATWLPATTTLAAVEQALHSRLSADDYYRAMRLLLSKAERAIAVQVAQAPPGQNLEGFTVRLDDIAIDSLPASPLALSPVSEARVELAEAWIREADASGDWLAEPMKGRIAALAVTDLGRTERQALALRLHDRPLVNATGGVSLGADALERDDATMIQKAILDVQMLANLQARASRGVGLGVAIERAGELVRAAHAKLEQLPPHAPEAERKKAQAEVQRLESMFFGPSSPVLAMLRMNAQRAGDADGGVATIAAQMRALGADSVTIAAEELRAVPSGDVAMLVSTLRKTAPEDRILALQRAGLLDALSNGSIKLSPDQGELVSALVWQGSQPFQLGPQGADAPRVADTPTSTMEAPIVMPPTLAPPLLGPRPEVVIALHDILDAMDRRAVHEVLGRLARMSDADQRAIYSDPRYRAKLNALPEGHPQSAAGHEKDSLRMAQASGARAALLGYPTTIESEHKVHVEALGAEVDALGPGGQASLRRAYVLVERLGGAETVRTHPALLTSLPAGDRASVERLVGIGAGGRSGGLLGKRDHLAEGDDRETANQLIFGQPQLAGNGPGALDPATEAEFMYYRLREAAGIRDGVSIADWFNTAGPSADEAVAEFMVLYQRVHGAGASRGELAQLADLYYRALRRLDSYRKVADSLAGTAAQIVGATVATIVVTVASGGTLGPVAVGAMASVSAAAGAAAAGAALRIHSTMASVLKDAGTGAVEGIATAAGASLAARVVRGATMGLPAGRVAASVGARAVGQVSHAGTEIAATVIDSALGGAAGELFQTATDEATWDRGVAEAFAAMLAAIARGAGSGAAIGGAVGGAAQVAGKLLRLVARAGRPAAQDFTRVAESVGINTHALEHLTEHAQDQVARALELARAGQVAEAERLLSSVDGLAGQAGAIARKVAGESTAAPKGTTKAEDSSPAHGHAPAAEHRRASEHPDPEGRIRNTSGRQVAAVDGRTRVTHDRLAEMSRRLEIRVEIDETGALHDGIELHYVLEAHRNIRPALLRVGPESLIDDVLAHGHVIERVTRYNGAIGRLRQLWDRFVALVKRSGRPLQPGTKAWESYQELAKLEELIALRQSARMAHGIVEPSILDKEIAFLEGYRAHHEAIIAEAEKGGAHAKPTGHIDSPDSWRNALGDEDPSIAGTHVVDPLGKTPHHVRLPVAKGIDPTVPPDRASSGFWTDEHAKGNTAWYSDNQLLNEVTGYKPVMFKDGYPILDDYTQQTVRLEYMFGDKRDFGTCDIELARRFAKFKRDGTPNQSWAEDYRRVNKLTWHHHQDRVRMQLVPRDLHENLPHAGGASGARTDAPLEGGT